MLGSSEQLLEAGIVADRVPDRIDFQARGGNDLAGGNGEESPKGAHCIAGRASARLNLGQASQIPSSKHRPLAAGIRTTP